MKCPHCQHVIHAQKFVSTLPWGHTATPWSATIIKCPQCSDFIIDLIKDRNTSSPEVMRAFPVGTSRPPVPREVPSDVAQIYTEACAVLPTSTRASAALSRRCLQHILHAHGYVDRNLDREIQALLNETDNRKAVPIALRQTIDAIRNFGNFGAHPMADTATLQVIDVEPEEAEWCLEILEAMFEHFYVAPAAAAARKASLDAKLKAAGKPPSK